MEYVKPLLDEAPLFYDPHSTIESVLILTYSLPRCVTCTINMLLSIICLVIVVGVVIGLLFVFDVFNTNNKDGKDGTKAVTEAIDIIKNAARNVS